MSISKKTWLLIIAFFCVYVFWGSTFLWNKMAVKELPPFFLASIRFTSAGLLVFAISIATRKSLAITRKQLLNCTLAGFLFLAYGNGVFVWALKWVDTGFASLLASLQPLIILLMMRVIQRKKLQWKSMVGVTLGIIGMYLLVSQKDIISKEGMVIGILMILSCLIAWCSGSLFVAKADLPKNFFVATAYQMIAAGVILVIASLCFQEPWKSPLVWQDNTQIAIICLILFGSIAAFTSFNYLLKHVSPEKVTTSSFVNPVIAILLGWYFLEESISLQTGIAALLLLTGVYFINSRKRDKPVVVAKTKV
ncbi:EamA family transporter [Nonlabens ponticola]|uniref:EamA family transporter n=1 Tax=Nonlabens ponticola TaxID=2496866 RepID=A0A3S9MYY0_9FLAO|nr:EamA family transporter [Nonlabens ponticola]AZQ44349.1 EamA family transporter [Nonlabens ponticola]